MLCTGCVCGHGPVLQVKIYEDEKDYVFAETWSQFTGFSLDQIPLVWKNLIHPDDIDDCIFQFEIALKRSCEVQFEVRIRYHDSNYRWLLVNIKPSLDKSAIASFIDITPIKSSNQEYELENSLIRTVADSIHGLMAYINPAYRFVYVNNGFRSVFNMNLTDIKWLTLRDMFKDKLDEITSRAESALSGTPQHFEIVIKDQLYICEMIPDCDEKSVKGMVLFFKLVKSKTKETTTAIDISNKLIEAITAEQIDPSEIIGNLIARLGFCHLHSLSFHASICYFDFRQICDRIDHIIANKDVRIKGQRGSILSKNIKIEHRDKIICLHDNSVEHFDKHLGLLVDDDEYFVFCFHEKGESNSGSLAHWSGKTDFVSMIDVVTNSDMFWHFRRPQSPQFGVESHSRGFYDLIATKSVADFIVGASILTGFKKETCG